MVQGTDYDYHDCDDCGDCDDYDDYDDCDDCDDRENLATLHHTPLMIFLRKTSFGRPLFTKTTPSLVLAMSAQLI